MYRARRPSFRTYFFMFLSDQNNGCNTVIFAEQATHRYLCEWWPVLWPKPCVPGPNYCNPFNYFSSFPTHSFFEPSTSCFIYVHWNSGVVILPTLSSLHGGHNDNLRCRHCRQSWHDDNFRFLVYYISPQHQFNHFSNLQCCNSYRDRDTWPAVITHTLAHHIIAHNDWPQTWQPL